MLYARGVQGDRAGPHRDRPGPRPRGSVAPAAGGRAAEDGGPAGLAPLGAGRRHLRRRDLRRVLRRGAGRPAHGHLQRPQLRAAPAAERLQERAQLVVNVGRRRHLRPLRPRLYRLVGRPVHRRRLVRRRRGRRPRRPPDPAGRAAWAHRPHRDGGHRQAGWPSPDAGPGHRLRRPCGSRAGAPRPAPARLGVRHGYAGRRPRVADGLRGAHRRRAAAPDRAGARALHRGVGEGHPPGARGGPPAAVAADGRALAHRSRRRRGRGGTRRGAGVRRGVRGDGGAHRVPPPPGRAGLDAPTGAAARGVRRRRRAAGARPRGHRRPHQRGRGVPERRRSGDRSDPRDPAMRRPLLPQGDPRLDGHRVPGALDEDRAVAGRDRAAAGRRVHRCRAGPHRGRDHASTSWPPSRRSVWRWSWVPRATGWAGGPSPARI